MVTLLTSTAVIRTMVAEHGAEHRTITAYNTSTTRSCRQHHFLLCSTANLAGSLTISSMMVGNLRPEDERAAWQRRLLYARELANPMFAQQIETAKLKKAEEFNASRPQAEQLEEGI
jgi:hypothetical protein